MNIKYHGSSIWHYAQIGEREFKVGRSITPDDDDGFYLREQIDGRWIPLDDSEILEAILNKVDENE